MFNDACVDSKEDMIKREDERMTARVSIGNVDVGGSGGW